MGATTWPSFYAFEKLKVKEIQALDMKYHVKLKKNLEKRGAHHVEKKRVCQEDPNNKKIEVCDKIMSSFKVTHLFPSLLYSSLKIYTQ